MFDCKVTLLSMTTSKERIIPSWTSTDAWKQCKFTIEGEGHEEYVDQFLQMVADLEMTQMKK